MSQKWMSRKWDDAELDAHQFAAARLFSGLDQIDEEIGQINGKDQAGIATAENIEHRKRLQAQWQEIMRDIGDTNERLVRGDPLPPPSMS